MQTNLAPEYQNTADGQEAEAILRKCVHCGFCTATCPTYLLLGDELIRNGLMGADSAALSIGEVTVVDEASSTIRDLTERSDNAQPINWALPF